LSCRRCASAQSELVEQGLAIVEQGPGSVELHDLALVQHHDTKVKIIETEKNNDLKN
jgi:hypothetical protein